MKKSITLILIAVLMIVLWYFFIKQYDYQVSFKVNAAPGSLYYNTLAIDSWETASEKIQNVTIIDTVLLKTIKQKFKSPEDTFILDWHFKTIEDTITKITVGYVSEKKSISNRMSVLTGTSDFVDSYKEQMKGYHKILIDFSKSFRVHIDGVDEIPSVEYACISRKTKRPDKAKGMITANRDLFPKIPRNSFTKKILPLIVVERWDLKSDSIWFNYGFPIINKDSLKTSSTIKYREQIPRKALKATYFGNYRNSDQAWFSLLEYATINNIAVEKTPIEIFYNNPMQGGDELQWKAEIFLPIK